MKTCYILRGIPGSGKSTFVSKLEKPYTVFSADKFFMHDGVYQFDISEIGKAHNWCLREFMIHMQITHDNNDTIIVDNTNTRLVEVAPYAAIAAAHGYDIQVVTILCDPLVAAERNIHGVPLENIQKMAAVLDEETKRMPSWWRHVEI